MVPQIPVEILRISTGICGLLCRFIQLVLLHRRQNAQIPLETFVIVVFNVILNHPNQRRSIRKSFSVVADWGTSQEKRQVLTLRLDKPKDKHLVGVVEL